MSSIRDIDQINWQFYITSSAKLLLLLTMITTMLFEQMYIWVFGEEITMYVIDVAFFFADSHQHGHQICIYLFKKTAKQQQQQQQQQKIFYIKLTEVKITTISFRKWFNT